MEKRNTTLLEDVQNSIALLKLSEASPRYFAFVTGLALLVTVLSTYSIGLLVPIAHGIITGSFTQLLTLPGVAQVATWFPFFFEKPVHTFLLLVGMLYVITIVKSGAQYYAQLHAQAQAKTATLLLREKLFRVCMYLNKQFYDERQISSVHHTFTRLPHVLEAQFRMLQRFATQLILVTVYIVLMFLISWELALIVVLIVPVIGVVSHVTLSRVRALAHATEGQLENMSSSLLDVLFRMPIVQGFAKESYEIERFRTLNQDEIEQSFREKQFTNLVEPLEALSTTTAALFVAFGIALLLHTNQAVEPSLLFVFFFLALQVLRSISVFNTLKVSIATAQPVVDQLREILEGQARYMVAGGVLQLPPIQSGIDIRGLSFRYPTSNTSALTDVTFFIPKGQVVALVGPTGSGKSTIGSMLLRLYDCPPETIFIDGVDIRTYAVDSVRARMSFVYQDPLLFSASIEHNVLYATQGDMSATIDEALKRFCLTDVVLHADQGIEASVGDGASHLSGGQKKLIALVRAMLRSHDFLLLDEATNSLDATTEQQVLDEVLQQSKGKTVLLISHRLSAIKRADRIVYIEHGRVIEEGTYDALMEQGGAFAAMWKQPKV